MSKQDQAAMVIDNNLPIAERIERHAHACIIADALKEAGLIAPDTPQPFFERGVGPNWEIPISDQYGGVVTVRTLGGSVFIERHGHGYGHGFITNPAEARKIAAAILAAANHAEEETTNA